MATAKRYSIYPCSFVHAGGTMDLDQMDSFEVMADVRKNAIIPGGAVDRAHIGIAAATPRATFNTRDLSTLFGTVSPSAGLALTGNATFRLQRRENGSTFSTGGSHETFVATGGFLYPTTLTASQDQEDGASCTCECVALWDGTNEPWAHSTSVDFDLATDPVYVSRYFLGPVYENTTELEGIISTTVDFGINYEARAFSGDAYPRLGAIITREPRITFTMANATQLASNSLFGNAIDTSLAVYYRAGVASGTRVANATSSHVKISCSAGDISHENVSVQGNEDGTVTVTVMPTGTLSISVGSAIP